eukprot:1888045-Pyramimonas_sp.AAC.1
MRLGGPEPHAAKQRTPKRSCEKNQQRASGRPHRARTEHSQSWATLGKACWKSKLSRDGIRAGATSCIE